MKISSLCKIFDFNRVFKIIKVSLYQRVIYVFVTFTEGWLKVDVTYVVKNWLEYQDSPTHAISVACKTCGMEKSQSPISFSQEKPFLVIYTHSQHRKSFHRRSKRQVDCGPGVNECCRESFYVSFADIGWDDWIISPPGYNAYFCKGSCATASALTLSATQHNTILQVIIEIYYLNYKIIKCLFFFYIESYEWAKQKSWISSRINPLLCCHSISASALSLHGQ